MLLSIDYLQITLSITSPDSIQKTTHRQKDFTLIELPFGTKHYKRKYSVYWQEKLIGSLLTHSRGLVNEYYILFQFENWVFYTGFMHQYYTRFKKAFKTTFVSITRLDIALDMNETTMPNELFQSFCKNLSSDEIINVQKTSNVVFNTQLIKGHRIYNSILFGSRKGDKYVKMYNKTLEMNQVDVKPWILDFWLANELYGEVFRLEVTLKRRYWKGKAQESVFEKLGTSLQSFFIGAMRSYFRFVINDGGRNARAEHWPFIPFHLISGDPITIDPETAPKTRDSVKMRVTTAKRLLRDYYNRRNNDFIPMIKQILNVNPFAERRFYYKFDDYVKELERDSPHGVKFKTSQFWKLYNYE